MAKISCCIQPFLSYFTFHEFSFPRPLREDETRQVFIVLTWLSLPHCKCVYIFFYIDHIYSFFFFLFIYIFYYCLLKNFFLLHHSWLFFVVVVVVAHMYPISMITSLNLWCQDISTSHHVLSNSTCA